MAPFHSSCQALHYLVLISEVDEKEIFKICLEHWNHLTSELYRENPFSSSQSPLMLSTASIPPRRQLYLPVLSKVRVGLWDWSILVTRGRGLTGICDKCAPCILFLLLPHSIPPSFFSISSPSSFPFSCSPSASVLQAPVLVLV